MVDGVSVRAPEVDEEVVTDAACPPPGRWCPLPPGVIEVFECILVGLGEDSLREPPGDPFDGLSKRREVFVDVFWDLDKRTEAGLERGNGRPLPKSEGPFLTASAPAPRTVCNKSTDGLYRPTKPFPNMNHGIRLTSTHIFNVLYLRLSKIILLL